MNDKWLLAKSYTGINGATGNKRKVVQPILGALNALILIKVVRERSIIGA